MANKKHFEHSGKQGRQWRGARGSSAPPGFAAGEQRGSIAPPGFTVLDFRPKASKINVLKDI